MGEILAYEKVKLVVGVLYSGSEGPEGAQKRFDEVLAALKTEFGECDLVSHEMLFSFTNYYDAEMEAPIYKRLLSFKELVNPMDLAAIKVKTNELEKRWQTESRRPVNLDPGILDLSHLILATTKNRGHRFTIGQGIYGELTLLYMNGAFQGQPWTYDDFNTDEYKQILCEIRELYRPQRKAELKKSRELAGTSQNK